MLLGTGLLFLVMFSDSRVDWQPRKYNACTSVKFLQPDNTKDSFLSLNRVKVVNIIGEASK